MDILDENYRSLREEWEEEVLKRCERYIFYYQYSKTKRRGFCTICGRELEADREDGGYWHEFYHAKHNSSGLCPNCGSEVVFKAVGRYRSGPGTLSQVQRMLFVDVRSPECVWIRGFYCEVKFWNFFTEPEVSFGEMVRYELTPGKATMVARTYSDFAGYTKWKQRKTIGEPWPMTSNGRTIEYDIGSTAELENTFLRYIPLEEFFEREYPVDRYGAHYFTNRIPWGKILSCAARYPFAFEMAVKYGLEDLWMSLVCYGNKHAIHINWKAKDAGHFLRGIPKQDYKTILKSRNLLNTMEMYKHLEISAKKAEEYGAGFNWYDVAEISAQLGDDPKVIMDYLMKQGFRQGGLYVLRDYRAAAEVLGRDTDVPTIRWPKTLATAHDEATKAAEHLKTEMMFPYYRNKVYPRYRDLYEFVEDGYMAIVPEQLSDIKLEGTIQHHCVGGYLDRHATGNTIIIFIRRTMLPAIPLYTVEISPDGNLRQIQGYHNEERNKPTPEADAFVKRWLAEVQRRLAKDKKKKKKEEAA